MTRARDVANLIGSGNYSSTTFTATAGQTAFTISHTQGFVQVFMNGLLLDETVDYTSNGSAVTLTSGAAAGDEIEVVAYNTFSVGDALNQAAADTRYVNASGDTMSGDLTIDTNTFHVDVADNRVGVGTNTPAKVLDITESASADTGQVKLTYAGGDGNRAGFILNNTHTGGREYGIYAGNNSTGGGLGNSLGISDNTASTAYRLLIDSSGRVTLPNQIGFSYLGSKSYVIGTTGTQAMSSSNVWASNVNHGHNRGSHFSPSTGRFTCPISGRYQFRFKCQASNHGSGYLWFYMRLNQSVFSYCYMDQQTAWNTMYLGGTLELNANDYVDVAWTNNYVSGQIHLPEFSGELIG